MNHSKSKRTKKLSTKNLSEVVEQLARIEEKTHKQFHSKASVKKKKKAAKQSRPPVENGKSGLRPPERSVSCRKKKAIVIIGCLTGNPIADAAYRNTANEAVSDLTDRGYETTLLNLPTNEQVRSFIADPCVKAFVYVGHGSDSDSGNSNVGGKSGGDIIWPNCDEVITSSEIRRWLNGGSMELVILHACFQGAKNTSQRWQSAFGVDGSSFSSWSGLCRYFSAYWWQFVWY